MIKDFKTYKLNENKKNSFIPLKLRFTHGLGIIGEFNPLKRIIRDEKYLNVIEDLILNKTIRFICYLYRGGENFEVVLHVKEVEFNYFGVLIVFGDVLNGDTHGCYDQGDFSYAVDETKEITILGGEDIEFYLKEIKRKKEELKLKHMDVDPYGEEDWTNESMSFNDFKVGDPIIYTYNKHGDDYLGIGRISNLYGLKGRVVDVTTFTLSNILGIEFEKNILDLLPSSFCGHTCRGKGKSGHCLWVDYSFIDLDEKEKLRKEKLNKKLRLKHIDVDPYGEEDWTNESIENEKDIDELDLLEWQNENENLYLLQKDIEPEHCVLYKDYDCVYDLRIVKIFKVRDVKQELIKGRRILIYDKITNKFNRISYEELKFIKNPEELKRRKEELRLKNIDIDPYGEEDWVGEGFKWWVKKKPEPKQSLLYNAINSDDHEEAIRLIDSGYDVNELKLPRADWDTFDVGWSPLMLASLTGKIDIVRRLVHAGANVNYVDENGNDALGWAVHNLHIDIVKFLLENGANVFQHNVHHGGTAIELAYNNYRTGFRGVMNQEERKLLKIKSGKICLILIKHIKENFPERYDEFKQFTPKIFSKEEIEERKRRREELRLKHIDVDPYGEEDWLE